MIARLQKWLRARRERKLLAEIALMDRFERECGALSAEGVVRREVAKVELAKLRRGEMSIEETQIELDLAIAAFDRRLAAEGVLGGLGGIKSAYITGWIERADYERTR
jgi:hypothetical protein